MFCPAAVVGGYRCEEAAVDEETEDAAGLQISNLEFDFLASSVAGARDFDLSFS